MMIQEKNNRFIENVVKAFFAFILLLLLFGITQKVITSVVPDHQKTMQTVPSAHTLAVHASDERS